MMLKINKFFILVIFAISGCSHSSNLVTTPTGEKIIIPSCNEYVNSFAKINFRMDLLQKYSGEISISKDTTVKLQDSQQHFALQAEELCSVAPTMITMGKGEVYLCRHERLSNSAFQIEILNRFLETIKTEADAKNQSEKIVKLIDDFVEKSLDSAVDSCSSVTKYGKIKEQIEIYEKLENIRYRIVEKSKKLSEAYKNSNGLSTNKEFVVLKAELDLLKSDFEMIEGALSKLENREIRKLRLDILPPNPPMNLRLK